MILDDAERAQLDEREKFELNNCVIRATIQTKLVPNHHVSAATDPDGDVLMDEGYGSRQDVNQNTHTVPAISSADACPHDTTKKTASNDGPLGKTMKKNKRDSGKAAPRKDQLAKQLPPKIKVQQTVSPTKKTPTDKSSSS